MRPPNAEPGGSGSPARGARTVMSGLTITPTDFNVSGMSPSRPRDDLDHLDSSSSAEVRRPRVSVLRDVRRLPSIIVVVVVVVVGGGHHASAAARRSFAFSRALATRQGVGVTRVAGKISYLGRGEEPGDESASRSKIRAKTRESPIDFTALADDRSERHRPAIERRTT